MRKKIYSTDLKDAEWEILEPLLKKQLERQDPRGKKLEHSLREIVNAIRYVLGNGIKWKDIPEGFPPSGTVYYHCAKWRDKGFWKSINKRMRRRLRALAGRHPDASIALADSQSVKGTMRSDNGYDGNKKVNGIRRQILVCTMGFLLNVAITTANTSDKEGLRHLLAGLYHDCPRLKTIRTDQGYRLGATFKNYILEAYSWVIEMILRPKDHKGFVVIPKRWVVERTFAWLGNYRRLCKHYEVLDSSAESFIYMAMVDLMTKRLAGTSTTSFRS